MYRKISIYNISVQQYKINLTNYAWLRTILSNKASLAVATTTPMSIKVQTFLFCIFSFTSFMTLIIYVMSNLEKFAIVKIIIKERIVCINVGAKAPN